MHVVVIGASGMLGQDLLPVLASAGHTAVGLDRPNIDITSRKSCQTALEGKKPDAIINCAAWTAVDEAESHEPEAFRVNAVGAYNLAREARALKSRFVQISTDYVFRGDSRAPVAESHAIDPVSAYGRTKAAGEWAVQSSNPDSLIVRTAWLYGAHGNCFPKTVARILRQRGVMSVVDDQFGQPTWTVDLADLLVNLLELGAPGGIYHGTASGETSWFGFAQSVARSSGFEANSVSPTSSLEFVRPAPRPEYSVLAHEALDTIGVLPIGPWQERWDQASTLVTPVK